MNALEQYFNNKDWLLLECNTRDGEQWERVAINRQDWDTWSTEQREHDLITSIEHRVQSRLHNIQVTIEGEDGWHKHLDLHTFCKLSTAELDLHGLLQYIYEVNGFVSFYHWWFSEGIDDHEGDEDVDALLANAQVRRDLEQEVNAQILKGVNQNWILNQLKKMLS